MWIFRKRAVQTPPAASPVPAYVTPELEMESFGPVLRQNHIAYVPAREFSGVPGVGVSNLAYLPDFLVSAPETMQGNSTLRRANSITIANRPVAIVHSKQVLEGIGGLVAGQLVHQPLLSVDVQNGQSEVGE